MKKYFIIVLMLSTLLLSSCGQTNETVEITFSTGNMSESTTMTYNLTDSFVLPEDPVRDHHSFQGWYYDTTFETPFSLKDVISRDLTLYAKFDPIIHTVDFYCNDDILCYSFDFTEGNEIIIPADPLQKGYDFDGWYYDKALTEPLEENHIVLESTTLYAGQKVIDYDIKIYDKDRNLLDTVTLTIEDHFLETLISLGYYSLYKDDTFLQEIDEDFDITLGLDVYYDSTEKLVIGANIYSFSDNYMYDKVKPSLEALALEQDIELLLVDSDGDQGLLYSQVDTFIEQGVDVLLINLVFPSAVDTIINKAEAAGIPLILYLKEPEYYVTNYKSVYYIGQDFLDAGKQQGDMILANWESNPNWDKNNDGIIDYVLLKGEIGHPYAEARTSTVINTITDAGVSVNELALLADNYWSAAFGENTMDTWITSFGDSIELVIANNDAMALGAVAAMETAGVSIPVYGIDGLDQALESINNDSMTGTVMNDVDGLNQAILDLAVQLGHGISPTFESDVNLVKDGALTSIYIDHIIVTEDNVEDYR